MKNRWFDFSVPMALAFAGAFGIFAFGATSLERHDGTLTVHTSDRTVEVTPLSGDIFRVTSYPRGSRPDYPQSQSAVLQPLGAGETVAAGSDWVTLTTPGTEVRINRATGELAFFDPQGELLMAEAGGVDNAGDVKTVRLAGGDSEIFYGAGERGHSLRLNGDTLRMYNRQNYGYTGSDKRISQMNITVPWIVSDLGYGILFDDYNDAELIVGDTISYVSDTPKPLSYYFVNGEGSLAGALDGYARLTGHQGLPPFWTLGYITSKYGYRTQAETLGAIDSLKRDGYPVDGIVLDLYWYGKESDMGRLEWNREQWPDHKKMLADLKKQGVNLVAISQPYINKIGAIDNYNLLDSLGMLVKDSDGKTHDVTTWVGEAGMFDMSNPATRHWLWDRYRDLTLDGVEGWWGDLGEPEVHPLTMIHDNGETASQYHNVYGNEWSRLLYEGFRQEFPDRRLMLLMRGGTAGLQRYNVFPWSTDVSRSWGGLEPQVKIMLNSGLSGLGYMSSDIGGFAVDPEKPLDPELYVRWLQMGTFTPTLRTHAQFKPEPYHYPAHKATLLKYIKMRYEWLPYNYTLAYENATKGYPLARPLNFNGENPEDKYADTTDEYLWGDNVLVAPVMKAGARSRKVLFPAGTWVNWHNPRLTYKGGTTATVAAPLSQLPLFVREGAFIPQYMEPIENVTQYDPTYLTVKYFPSAEETGYEMYEDDRVSPEALADGAYKLLQFHGQKEGNTVNVELSATGQGYAGMPDVKMITLQIPGLARTPREVTVSDGCEMRKCASLKAIRQSGWHYDASSGTLSVRFPWNYETTDVNITL